MRFAEPMYTYFRACVPDEKNIRLEQVINLSYKLRSGGKLDWNKPDPL